MIIRLSLKLTLAVICYGSFNLWYCWLTSLSPVFTKDTINIFQLEITYFFIIFLSATIS